MATSNSNTIPIKCSNCGREWNYGGKHAPEPANEEVEVCCPSCRYRVEIAPQRQDQ